jgi:hypothetical protein
MLGSGQTRSQHQAEHTVVDGKQVLAEFNWNSAYEPIDFGTYISAPGSDPTNEYSIEPFRENLCLTPKGITSPAGLHSAVGGCTIAVSSNGADPWSIDGKNTYMRATTNTTTPGTWGISIQGLYPMLIDSSSDYAVQAMIRVPHTIGYTAALWFEKLDKNNNQVSDAYSTLVWTGTINNSSGWVEAQAIIPESDLPADCVRGRLLLAVNGTRENGSAAVSGDQIRITGVVVEKGSSMSYYFDGDMTDTPDKNYSWFAGANISKSYLHYKRPLSQTSGEPTDYDIVSEYVDDADVSSYQADVTGKNTRDFSLYDCFTPHRPDAGIVHAKAVVTSRGIAKNMLYQKTSKTRFYAPSDKNQFKYWNSAYTRKYKVGGGRLYKSSGVTDSSGLINDANPYAVYENMFTPKSYTEYRDSYSDSFASKPGLDYQPQRLIINSIRFKMQTYAGTDLYRTAKSIDIDVLPPNSNTWTEVYSNASVTMGENGVFQIWKQPSTGLWSTTEQNPKNMEDFDIEQWSSSKAFQLVRGIRLRVKSLNVNGSDDSGIPFELIELAPLTTMDITDNVSNISITKSFNDSEFGLPFGSLNGDTGTITVQNIDDIREDLNFMSNEAVLRGMSRNGFLLKTYFIPENPDGVSEKIPLKNMYCFGGDSGDSFQMKFNLSDKISMLKDMDAPNVFVRNRVFSSILGIVFDNIGWTNYDFSSIKGTAGDTKLQYFFSTSDDSAEEVLEQLCKSVGATIYEDEYGIIRAKTRHQTFGEYLNPWGALSDSDITYDPLPTSEAYFGYEAADVTAVKSKSNWFNFSYGTSGFSASTGPVKYFTHPGLKYRRMLTMTRTSGTLTDPFAINSGQSTGTANNYINPIHTGRPVTLSVLTRTSVGTANVEINVMYYDRNRYYIGKSNNAGRTVNTTQQVIEFTHTNAYADAAYYGIEILINSISQNGVRTYFTEIMAQTGQLAAIESYTIETIDSISGGSIKYNPRGIFKKADDISKQDEISNKRYLSEARQEVWKPGQAYYATPTESLENTDEAVLGASVLLKDIDALGTDIAKSIDLSTANSEEEAQALLDKEPVCWMTLEGQSGNSIVNYQGFVMINGELIRFDGREFTYVIDGVSKTSKLRSAEEYQNIRVLSGKNLTIYPTGRIRVFSRVKADSRGKWKLVEFGRAQFGTRERGHKTDINLETAWVAKGTVPNIEPKGLANEYKPVATTSRKSIFGETTYFGSCVLSPAKRQTYSSSAVGMLIRDMGGTMSRFGTRVRIQDSGSQVAGMVVGTKTGVNNAPDGFYFQIRTTKSAGTGNNIQFYSLLPYGSSLVRLDLWSGKSAIYSNSLNSVDNTINSTSSESDQKGIYDLEVGYGVRSDGKWRFDLFINGKKLTTVVYNVQGKKFNAGAGPFVVGSSTAAFENFWAASGNLSAFKGQDASPVSVDYGFNDIKRFGEASGSLDLEFLRTDKYKIFYEEFGTVVREAKYFNAKFEPAPVTKLRTQRGSKPNGRYAIANMRSGTFGADLLVVNMGKGLINIGGGNETISPLALSGVVLSALGDRRLPLSNIINKTGKETMHRKMRQSERRLGRAVGVEITGDFICTQEQAEKLAEFYIEHLTREQIKISASVFGNPCYQIGDIMAVRVMEQTGETWGKFIITDISHSFDDGLQTDIILRRVGVLDRAEVHSI